MSDILDIQSRCCSELDEESDNVTSALMQSSKNRKGRGFIERSGGELQNIRFFDQLVSSDEYGSRQQPQKSVEGWMLFVTGIHEEASEDDLKDIFQEYGSIKSLVLNLDRRTGYIKGYALIEFEKFQEAFNAKENLNESQLFGETIQVNWGFVKGPNAVHRLREKRSNIRSYFGHFN